MTKAKPRTLDEAMAFDPSVTDTQAKILAVSPSRYALAVEDYVEGTQALTREDLQIPQMILVQAQSKNVPDPNKHGGEFYNNLTGEFRAELNAVLLSEAKGRVCFPREYDGESDPLCGSDDALKPRAEYFGAEVSDTKLSIRVVIGDNTCAECPLSKFGPNSEAPMCAKAYTYAMLDAETGLPFLIRAARTATQAAKQLNTIAKTLGRRKYIKITSRFVTSDKGNYYVPVFATHGDTEPELKTWAMQYSLEAGNIARRVALTNGTTKPAPKDDIPI